MKAIEVNTRTDKTGYLKLEIPLQQFEKNVRVLILLQEEGDVFDDEQKWLYALSENPALDFLKEPEEEVYTVNDGIPYQNEK